MYRNVGLQTLAAIINVLQGTLVSNHLLEYIPQVLVLIMFHKAAAMIIFRLICYLDCVVYHKCRVESSDEFFISFATALQQ